MKNLRWIGISFVVVIACGAALALPLGSAEPSIKVLEIDAGPSLEGADAVYAEIMVELAQIRSDLLALRSELGGLDD